MANEGWHLRKIGTLFAYFEQREPKEIKYRIETSSNKNMSSEDKGIFRERGWEHVTRYGEFNVFSSPADIQAPELYPDPIKQSYTLKILEKKLRKSAYLISLLSVIYLIVSIVFWLLDKTPMLRLVEETLTLNFGLYIIYLFIVYFLIRATLSIRKLRTNLSKGKEIDHKAPWRRLRKVKVITMVLFISMATVFAVLPWMQIVMNKTVTLPIEAKDLPMVRLADIEKTTNLVREEYFYEKDLDINNRYSSKSSFFAPIQYESNEKGVIADQVWVDGGAVYSPSIQTVVYKHRFSFMQDSLISDLFTRNGWDYNRENFVKQDSDGFDSLQINKVDELTEVLATKGNSIIYVSYFGKASLAVIVEEVEEKMALLEK